MAWVRGTAALVASMTALTLSVPPCSAADARQANTPKAPKAKRTLSASAEAQVASLASPRLLAQDASGGAVSGESRSFFRTPTGVAALVIMAVGGGYVLYSVKNDQDPVKSPIR